MSKLTSNRRMASGRLWYLAIPLVFAVGDASREGSRVRWWEGGLVPRALAGGGNGVDRDQDGLPDEIEAIFLTQPLNRDTDGDGFDDGLEWVQRSDPLDAGSVPHLGVSLRTYAYQEDAAEARVFSAMWPGNLGLLEQFVLYFGSPDLSGPEGNAALGLMDVTPLLPQLVGQLGVQASQGMLLLTFSLDLPLQLLDDYDPLSVGIGTRIGGVPLVERMSFTGSAGSRMVLFPDPSLVPGAATASYWFMPLDPSGAALFGAGGGAGDPEYCETQLDQGTPTGAGGIVHQVQAANCTPQGFLYCIATDCAKLTGQSITLIDYGFLQTKAKQ